MLEAGKTHHIEIKGEIPPHVVQYLKHELGDNVVFEEDDELVNIFDTDWYEKINSDLSPADVLKTYRENAGLSQAALGEKLSGVSRQRVSDMENGHRSISKDMAKKLSKVLNAPVERFI